MASERIQRRIDRVLDQAEEAADQSNWEQVKEFAENILAFDPDNVDAKGFLAAAERALGAAAAEPSETSSPSPIPSIISLTSDAQSEQPTSFADGRDQVKRFLGEGGKKKVYLATDTLLDRDVAFALIKTEGLDEASRTRITREAQAMGRLGSHPHIVTVYDIGEENGQPYLVLPVLPGGDVEGIFRGHRVVRPAQQTVFCPMEKKAARRPGGSSSAKVISVCAAPTLYPL